MIQLTLITFLFDQSAFDWGMKLDSFQDPTIIVANPSLKEELEEMDTGACRIEYRLVDKEVSFYDCLLILNWLHLKEPIKTTSILFCESSLIYQQISFDLLYRGILQQTILSKEFTHHNLSETVRLQGLFFTLEVSLLEEIRKELSNQISQLVLGKEITHNHPILPIVNRFCKDINLAAINEIQGKVLHLIGDSHSLFTLTPNREIGCRSHILFDIKKYEKDNAFDFQFTHHLGSKTMHGFSNGEEFAKGFIEKQGVKKGDSVVFIFGEIDVRSHVYKYVSPEKTLEVIIKELVSSYIEKIDELTEELKPEVAIMGAIPPMDGPNYTSYEYPILGTLSQRVEATVALNKLLAAKCKERDFKFFEVNELYALEDGSLDMEQSDFFCHISHYHQKKAIKKMFKTICFGFKT